MSPTLALVLGWAAVSLALAIVVVLLVRTRRERAGTAALLARLEELQARMDAAAPAAGPGAASAPPSPPAGHPLPTPSGDVLAGLTTRVGRLVGGPEGEAATLAEQAIRRVHVGLDRGMTAHELAAGLHVSLRTLERGLLLALDCTPRQLILAMKMREARRLLLGGRLLVKEVAFRLGFGDQYHFSRCFKSFYHVSPSEIRPEPPPLR